jgi:hypothetical protein
MRTTLTLDDDVAAALKRLRKNQDRSLRELVNEALRLGLTQIGAPPSKPRKPFQTRSVDLGRCLVGDVDNVAEALAIAEGEAFK